MKPLMVEIIAYAPTQYFHCRHCEFVWNQAEIEGIKKFHEDAVETSMPPDMMREYQDLSDWVLDAVEQYNDRVVFKVVDAASFEGLIKSVRYGVHKYPAVIVDGREKYVGADLKQAETLINRRLQVRPA
jgi:hypothetical protein